MEKNKHLKRVQSTAIKGIQTNIPAEVRRALGIKEDSKLEWIIDDENRMVTITVLESTTDILQMFGSKLMG